MSYDQINLRVKLGATDALVCIRDTKHLCYSFFYLNIAGSHGGGGLGSVNYS